MLIVMLKIEYSYVVFVQINTDFVSLRVFYKNIKKLKKTILNGSTAQP